MTKSRFATLAFVGGVYIGSTSGPVFTALRHVINILTSDISFT